MRGKGGVGPCPTRSRPSEGDQEPESDNQTLASRVAGRRDTVPHEGIRQIGAILHAKAVSATVVKPFQTV